MSSYRILILGASYGSLLATKLALAGHDSTMVCLPHEVEAFNSKGAIIRMPVRGVEGLVEINSNQLKGKIDACSPEDATPSEYDLVVLAMQEPQYSSSPNIKTLLGQIAAAKRPCMSIMNMPPLTYLSRIPQLNTAELRHCYLSPEIWDQLDPKLITLCSPDPQAFRPPDEDVNVLQVRLPTNFKSARFVDDQHTAMLRAIEQSIEESRFSSADHGDLALPVKMKVHDSVFVPLAKWAMLLAGNYRCVQKQEMRPIQEAVHSDIETSRSVYEWVVQLCLSMGGDEADFVPFEKYANAAQSLASPSSAARALAAGAKNIERVDKLVQSIGKSYGKQNNEVDITVSLVDAWLDGNRKKAQ
jgi:hypothetical protein